MRSIRFVRPGLGMVIVAGVTLRVLLAPLYAHLPNHFTDEMFWKQWMLAIHERGVLNIFRASSTDYVGYHWILWMLASIYGVIGGPYTASTPSLHVLIKMPSILFDVVLIVVVYHATRLVVGSVMEPPSHDDLEQHKSTCERAALLAAGVIAFQPAVVYDSAVWAQTDAAITAAMLASVVLVTRGRPELGWAIWALGFMVKPHPVLVVPVLAVLTWRCGPAAVCRSLASVGAVFALVLGPWLLHGDGLRIIHVYHSLFNADYERLSASAWNLWWFRDVAAHPSPDDAITAAIPLLTYRVAGLLMSASAAAIAVVLVLMAPRLREALIGAAYLSFAFYVLPVSGHERYLYPFLGLLLPVAFIERRWLLWYVPASATLFLNLVVVAPPIDGLAGRWVESPFSLAVAAVNVVLFGSLTAYLMFVEARSLPALVVRRRKRRHNRIVHGGEIAEPS